MKSARLVILSVVISMLPACSGSSSNSTSSAVVSMNANISASELTSGYTPYTAEYQAIHAAGARGAQTAAPWSSLETTPNPLPMTGPTYDLTMINNPYFGVSALAGYGFTSILINIPIVAINARTMPADIAGLAFDDATVIARYHDLLDQVLPYLSSSSVKYVSLGNEVDTYFSTHSSELTAYKTLIEDARNYIHQKNPYLMVGVTTTFDGATSTQIANVASLDANMDVIILTYYPTDTAFTVRDPSTVSTDMAKMINIAGGKPLVMQEWGYPSSNSISISSSEQKQADFVSNTFLSWKQYGSSRIPFISFFKRRDWDTAQCAALSSQGSGQPFYEFLCSLGLLKNDGTPKLAYSALTTGISNLGP